jgi:hypothetical protein
MLSFTASRGPYSGTLKIENLSDVAVFRHHHPLVPRARRCRHFGAGRRLIGLDDPALKSPAIVLEAFSENLESKTLRAVMPVARFHSTMRGSRFTNRLL